MCLHPDGKCFGHRRSSNLSLHWSMDNRKTGEAGKSCIKLRSHMRGYGPRTEWMQKRQVTSEEEKVGYSLMALESLYCIYSWGLKKSCKSTSSGEGVSVSYAGMSGSTRDFITKYPYFKVASNLFAWIS